MNQEELLLELTSNSKSYFIKIEECQDYPSTAKEWIKVLNRYVIRTDLIDHYHKIKELGEGAYAKVYLYSKPNS